MVLSRAIKEERVQSLASELSEAESAVVVDFKGLDVPQVTELRRQVRAARGRYRVVKNRLALLSVKGTTFEPLTEHFTGTTAIAYTGDDPVALAKVLVGFAKKAPVLTVKAAVVQGHAIQPGDVRELADLPSKEELYARFLMLLQAPATQFLRVLTAVPRDFLNVLSQAEKKKVE